MSRFKAVLFPLILLFLYSCAAKKYNAELESQPDWVKQKPYIQGYYVGVGSALKVGTSHEYIEQSKEDALADLAGDISVEVSSTSVLHTMETQDGFTDYFDQHIELVTNDFLEGFEPVDFYETENRYWVYYRIDKNTYSEAKIRRKTAATDNAKSKYTAGQKAHQMLNPKEAATLYVQGLAAISPYLGEENPVQLNGQKTDIGNELYSSLNKLRSSFDILASKEEIFVKRGEILDLPINFQVLFDGKPAEGIPVSIQYSGGYLHKSHFQTNKAGLVSIELDKVQSRNEMEQLYASIDFQNIVYKATTNLIVRGLLSEYETEVADTKIYISMPGFDLVISKELCESINCESIRKLFNKNVLDAGYLISSTDQADYLLDVNLSFEDGETAGGMTAKYLKGNIDLINSNSKIIWTKSINRIKGVGQSTQAAKEAALAIFLKNFDLIYLKQALDVLE